MSSDRTLEERVQVLEVELQKTQQLLKRVLDEVEAIPPRGLAQFDATKFDNPSVMHSVYQLVASRAQKAPDGYATRREVKKLAASEDDLLKTEVDAKLDRMIEADTLETREGDDSRIRPVEGVDDAELGELFISNFERADARREMARKRGKQEALVENEF
jgi:hypothetical protein